MQIKSLKIKILEGLVIMDFVFTYIKYRAIKFMPFFFVIFCHAMWHVGSIPRPGIKPMFPG